jgi:hypothetical protein
MTMDNTTIKTNAKEDTTVHGCKPSKNQYQKHNMVIDNG